VYFPRAGEGAAAAGVCGGSRAPRRHPRPNRPLPGRAQPAAAPPSMRSRRPERLTSA